MSIRSICGRLDAILKDQGDSGLSGFTLAVVAVGIAIVALVALWGANVSVPGFNPAVVAPFLVASIGFGANAAFRPGLLSVVTVPLLCLALVLAGFASGCGWLAPTGAVCLLLFIAACCGAEGIRKSLRR
jgi:hypothetical protein